jgi:hypothetical protein
MPAIISKPRKLRLVNPPKKRRKPAAAPKRLGRKTSTPKRRKRPAAKRRNSPLTVFGPLNPPRSNKPMKKRKAGPKKAARKVTARRRVITKTVTRRRKNPGSVLSTKPGGVLRTVAMSAVGLVVARMVPQTVLGGRNSGLVGYAANAATAMAAGYATAKVTGNKQDGFNVAIGGFLYTVSRFLQERYNVVGQYLSLSGVGDAMSATPRQLGVIDENYYFNSPAITGSDGRAVLPRAVTEAASAAAAAAVAARPMPNMSGLGGMRSSWSAVQ